MRKVFNYVLSCLMVLWLTSAPIRATMVDVKGMWLISPMTGITYATSSTLIDASGEKVAYIFQAPKTGTLGKVGFRTGTVTTGDTLKISFQDVDLSNGNPDGNVDQFRTTVLADTDDNIWRQTGLVTSDGTDGGSKRAVTIGDFVAIVIEFDSYVAGNLNISMYSGQNRGQLTGNAHMVHFTTSWTKNATTVPNFTVEYDDGSYAFIASAVPYSAVATASTNLNSTPDERALKFVPAFKCVVDGAWVFVNNLANFDVILYDSSNNILGSLSVDTDIDNSSGSQNWHYVKFTQGNISLTAGATYRLAVKPTTTTSVTVYMVDVNPAASWNQTDQGQNFTYSERTDGGSWSDTATRRLTAGLSITQVDDGNGTGGGSTPPGRVIISKAQGPYLGSK